MESYREAWAELLNHNVAVFLGGNWIPLSEWHFFSFR